MLRTHFPFLFGFFLVLTFVACNPGDNRISYNHDIRPIINAKCITCHGGVKKSGGFSLLFREEALGETESGKLAIVPGDHSKSELYRRLIHSDPEQRMPLESEPLSQEEIDLITVWIDQGAEWEDHWAYVAPKPVTVPNIDSDWAKEDLDYFVLDRLHREGMEPEAEAERADLIRRVSLDLTGLPPSPELVDAFLQSDAPDAYEQAVDQLLASTQFGERWAAMWLDLARYADSKGYEKDPHRSIWKYREWVIHAFNADMPFDQFTTEQLAGDLLPDPDPDQYIATAFHRNTMTNTEGGTEDEEFRLAAVMDRVTTTFDIWQSTTIACVQCHSHPYDPFRHEEYYELMAIFNNSRDNDLTEERPNLEVFEPETESQIHKTLEFVRQLKPEQAIDPDASLTEQTKQAFFPRLRAIDCDEYHNVLFSGNSVTNWSNNAKAGIENQYYFVFADIPFEGLTGMKISYSARGNGAKVQVRLDSPEGPLLAEADFAQADKSRALPLQLDFSAVPDRAGKHHLVFELINVIKKIPEGTVNVQEVELEYAQEKRPPAALDRHLEELAALRKKADLTPIMQERRAEFSRKSYVFVRGNFMTKGDEVQPGTPGILPPLAEDLSPRLALAQWLVSPENPLTARVIVNRFWEQLFGTGIVQTLEDFGTQGEKPTHPELLDYLALRFMHAHQWSVKQLLREIVLSATYRQSSIQRPEKREKDPYNYLLSRGPRFRLSAEQVRDQALAVSGLLYDSIGGPSVMPPQPEGIWQVIYSDVSWKTADDHNRHRRGLYTYWRRTTPYPSMTAFDSPSREFCVSRRIRTNTPLQALVTLNDPVYLEAAEALGERMEKAGGDDLAACIRAGYKMVLAREPDAETVNVLKELHRQATAALSQEPQSVLPVANRTTPEGYDTPEEFVLTKPMTVVANALLNLDAFVTKE